MSREAVERIIGRAVADPSFRNLLATNPDEVLREGDVTPDEVQSLKGMDWDGIESVSRDLDARVSRWGTGAIGPSAPTPGG